MGARVCGSLFNPDGFCEQGATDKNHQYGDPECPREDPPEGASRRDRQGQSEHDAPGSHVQGDSPALLPPQLAWIERNEINHAESDSERDNNAPVVGDPKTSARGIDAPTLGLSAS